MGINCAFFNLLIYYTFTPLLVNAEHSYLEGNAKLHMMQCQQEIVNVGCWLSLPFRKRMYLSTDHIIAIMKATCFSEDRKLLFKIAAGDEFAFKQVYDYYFPKIKAFAFRVLLDVDCAQEVAQEVMLAFWQKGDGLREIRNVEAFLKTLSKRRTIDALRKLQRARAVKRNLKEQWQESSEETEERVLLREVRRLLEEGIDLLPPQQQKVYQLCHQEGLKYEEAARQLDIAPGTVQSHMKHALRFLRDYLKLHHIDVAVWLLIFNLN